VSFTLSGTQSLHLLDNSRRTVTGSLLAFELPASTDTGDRPQSFILIGGNSVGLRSTVEYVNNLALISLTALTLLFSNSELSLFRDCTFEILYSNIQYPPWFVSTKPVLFVIRLAAHY
jgi:hypothetical protein